MKNPPTNKLLIVGLAVLGLALTGCLTDSKDDDKAPTITSQPTSQSVAYGDTVTFAITATGSGTLAFAWYADGELIVDEEVVMTEGGTSTLKGVASAGESGAEFYCVVSNNKGSVTSDVVTLTITGLTEWPAADTVTLGAQGAVAGSAIDLDSAGVLTVGQVSANGYALLSRVDLVYLYSEDDDAHVLFNTMEAREFGIENDLFTQDYDLTKVQDIVGLLWVDEKPASQQLGMEWYEYVAEYEPEELFGAVEIEVGDMFLVKTTEGNYVFLEVESVTGTTDGNAGLVITISSL